MYTCTVGRKNGLSTGTTIRSMNMKTSTLSIVLSLALILTFQEFSLAQTIKPGKKKTKAPARKAMASSVRQEEFVEKTDHGQVNWTDQYVEAEGSSLIDSARFKLKNQARLMAQRGAIVDAQRNLLEIVNGVLVEGQTTVKDLVVQSDEVKTNVRGVLKGAVQVGKARFEDGVVYVRLRIPLYADGLAEAVDTTPPVPVPPGPETLPGSDSIPSQIMMSVNGNYRPRLFPKLTDDQNNLIWNMADSFDPTKGKAPQLVRQGQNSLEKIKGKKGVELLEATTDELGNLVLKGKSKERLEKWKKAGLLVWGIVKKLVLPI
jgi:hypothetical protein